MRMCSTTVIPGHGIILILSVNVNGVPVQYGEDVQQWLNMTYPGRSIGQLPYVTPKDFFPCGDT
ncbi:hypothetical protein L798_13802 [Zootermopsis nevadensis]|uniref:Uncharacterized protein n=1 Tax=Zootermopsis nevadensis TaxID=136037 RepID=A0A067QQ80_ZOONE|nr:hypothetical protein L798_13802 [Zootermopsis nevadensis]